MDDRCRWLRDRWRLLRDGRRKSKDTPDYLVFFMSHSAKAQNLHFLGPRGVLHGREALHSHVRTSHYNVQYLIIRIRPGSPVSLCHACLVYVCARGSQYEPCLNADTRTPCEGKKKTPQ